MSFERPLALLLLLALPLLWWLHRRLRGPVEIVVASLLPFVGAPANEARAAQRRTLDGELVCTLLAATALAFAVAAPVTGSRQQHLIVVHDNSPSMHALRVSGASGIAEASARLEAAAGDLTISTSMLRRGISSSQSGRNEAPLRADGLPESLLSHLERARARGAPGLVLLTDRDVPVGDDVLVVRPLTDPAPSARIVGAALASPDSVAVLLDAGDLGAAEVVVTLVGEGVMEERRVAMPTEIVTLPAPAAGSFEVTARWLAADGAVLANGDRHADRLEARRSGRVASVLLDGRAPRLAAALRALGVDVQPGGGQPPSGAYARLRGPDGRQVVFSGGVTAANPLTVADVDWRGSFAGVQPRSDTRLFARGRIAPSAEFVHEDLVRDRASSLLRASDVIRTTLDPESAASTWHRDPSFVVFAGALLDWLSGGPDRVRVIRAVPPDEIPGPAARESLDPAAVAALAFVPGGAGPPWDRRLTLLGAALIAVAAFLSGRRLFASRRPRRAA